MSDRFSVAVADGTGRVYEMDSRRYPSDSSAAVAVKRWLAASTAGTIGQVRLHLDSGATVVVRRFSRAVIKRTETAVDPPPVETFLDPLDGTDRDGGALEDASPAAMGRWAERYDALNGAPENDDDR